MRTEGKSNDSVIIIDNTRSISIIDTDSRIASIIIGNSVITIYIIENVVKALALSPL